MDIMRNNGHEKIRANSWKNYGKPWKFWQTVGKITEKIRANISENMLNSDISSRSSMQMMTNFRVIPQKYQLRTLV